MESMSVPSRSNRKVERGAGTPEGNYRWARYQRERVPPLATAADGRRILA